jgi:predicted kinase
MVVADANGLASLLGGRWAIVDYAFFAADRRAWIRAVADVVGVALLWR